MNHTPDRKIESVSAKQRIRLCNKIAELEDQNRDMLAALIDAYKIIRQHENPDLPGSAELRAIKSIIERATGRKIDEVINDRP